MCWILKLSWREGKIKPGTVEFLLQKRLKHRQNKDIVKDFQRVVNLLSAMTLTR